MHTLWQDLRYGLRMLLKHRGFTFTAVLSLALGIGANATIFSSADATLLRPFSFPNQARLVALFERKLAIGVAHATVSPGNVVEWRAQSQTLQVVGRPGIGIDNIDVDAATRHHVCVVHTPDAPTQSTAEHAMALMVALAKGIVRADRGFRERGWSAGRDFFGVELKGKTLGLVGLGRIGGTFARIARDGFATRVLVYDPYVHATRAFALPSPILISEPTRLLSTSSAVFCLKKKRTISF